MNIRASYENEPLIQPMYWNHKEDEAYTVPTQYYFGPNLIVAPITSPDNNTTLMGGVRAWLPAGRFVDLFRPHLVYDGNRYIHLHRDLSQIPVLAKEGTIFPLDSTPKLGNGSPRPTEITILLVVGADAHFELVEEPESGDGALQPPLSSFVRTPITWKQKDGILVIGPEWNGAGRWRQWHVKLVGHSGSDVQAMVPGFRVTKDDDGCSTTVALGNVHRWSPEGFEIALGQDLQLDVVDVKRRVFDVVHRSEMWYGDKDPVWDAVSREGDAVKTRVERLYRLNVDAALKNAVMEIWAADGRAPGSAKGHEVWAEVKGAKVEEVEEALKDYVIV
jgi:hypothetical protein